MAPLFASFLLQCFNLFLCDTGLYQNAGNMGPQLCYIHVMNVFGENVAKFFSLSKGILSETQNR